MTSCLGKSCSFCLPRMPFVNCRQFIYLVISLLVLRAGYGIWLYQFLIIAYLFTLLNPKNSNLYPASVAEQAGLSLTLSQTPEDRFSRDEAQMRYWGPCYRWKIFIHSNFEKKEKKKADLIESLIVIDSVHFRKNKQFTIQTKAILFHMYLLNFIFGFNNWLSFLGCVRTFSFYDRISS